MSLAIAVCTRNRPEELARCLASIVPSFAGGFVDEIIVSTDGVDRATEQVVAFYQADLPELRFIRGPRAGLAANRNGCINACRSDFLLFLDDDARLSRTFLAVALPHASPSSIVTGFEVRNGTNVTPHNADFLGFQRKSSTSGLRAIVINATIFPTAFLRANPFDEFYAFGSEEIDIANRALAAGLAIQYVDAANDHRHVLSARDGNDRAAVRSRIYFSVRRYREYEPSLTRLLLYLFVGPAHAALHALRSEGSRSMLFTSWDSWIAIGRAFRSRKATPIGGIEETSSATQSASVPSISIVVPTFRRPDQLRECLKGLSRQCLPPTEVIVVRRPEDKASAVVVQEFKNLARDVLVEEVGQVAAMKVGAAMTLGDIVAFTDDDAVPRSDWLKRLSRFYRDCSIGGVGGRDVVHADGRVVDGNETVVGSLLSTGRVVGNHHVGAGVPRSVDILKGVNCSFRREALSFPVGLRGKGAQVANDLALSLKARADGWRLVFDPGALVDHYPGPRFDADRRGGSSYVAAQDAAFNYSYTISSIRPEMAWKRLGYSLLVGDRVSPGGLRAMVGALRGEREVYSRALPAMKVSVIAWHKARRMPLEFVGLPCERAVTKPVPPSQREQPSDSGTDV